MICKFKMYQDNPVYRANMLSPGSDMFIYFIHTQNDNTGVTMTATIPWHEYNNLPTKCFELKEVENLPFLYNIIH